MQIFQSRHKRAVEFILSRRKFGTTFGLLENFPISSNIFFRFANVRFFSLSHVLRDDKKNTQRLLPLRIFVGNAGNPFLVSFDEIFVRADFFNLFFGFCEFPNFVLD